MCQTFTTFQISKQDPLNFEGGLINRFRPPKRVLIQAHLNVAWDHRFKTLPFWCLAPLSRRNMPLTTSNAPTCCPIWTHQMRVPDLPRVRLPHRFRVSTPGCGPALREPKGSVTTKQLPTKRLDLIMTT